MPIYNPGRVERAEFNGVVYRRYPDAKSYSDRAYFRCSAGDKRKHGINGSLHRDVWIATHGPIPDGHHVHHQDGDTSNNSLENLECLPAKEHAACHPLTPRHRRGKAYREHLRRVEKKRSDAKERVNWHQTPEGRAWHLEHAKAIGFGSVRPSPPTFEVRTLTCEQCGKQYEGKDVGRNRFCSNACKAKWRRDSGIDDVDDVCAFCGGAFRHNRFKSAAFCSPSCRNRARYQRDPGG